MPPPRRLPLEKRQRLEAKFHREGVADEARHEQKLLVAGRRGAELIAAPGREEKFACLVTSTDRLCGFRHVGLGGSSSMIRSLADVSMLARPRRGRAAGFGPPGAVREPGEPLLVGRENRGPSTGGVLLRPPERAGFARGPSATALKAVIICVQTSWCRRSVSGAVLAVSGG